MPALQHFWLNEHVDTIYFSVYLALLTLDIPLAGSPTTVRSHCKASIHTPTALNADSPDIC